ncbi:hypothetical protein [Ferruginivarius sediminum]|uniref:hypothetical protein n=1 Tax=Ferruginivarius sediminum TaxID=2661937 RepID=UPI0011C05460|nr:hypothetical protein [Ferruginivarius sediminum]
MTGLMKLLKSHAPWHRHEGHADDNGGSDGHEPRPMIGLYGQLSPEQRKRARNVKVRERSGRNDMPTVKHG